LFQFDIAQALILELFYSLRKTRLLSSMSSFNFRLENFNYHLLNPLKALLRHRVVKILSLLLLLALISVQLLWQPSFKSNVPLSQIKSPKLDHAHRKADKRPILQKNKMQDIHPDTKAHVESPNPPPPEPSTLKPETSKPIDDVKITITDKPASAKENRIADNSQIKNIEMSDPQLPDQPVLLQVEQDSEMIDVQSYDSQTFSVSKDFWTHASKNTKSIFAKLPVQYDKNFENPCFWQKFEGNLSIKNFDCKN